jgi:hypothetical protein
MGTKLDEGQSQLVEESLHWDGERKKEKLVHQK